MADPTKMTTQQFSDSLLANLNSDGPAQKTAREWILKETDNGKKPLSRSRMARELPGLLKMNVDITDLQAAGPQAGVAPPPSRSLASIGGAIDTGGKVLYRATAPVSEQLGGPSAASAVESTIGEAQQGGRQFQQQFPQSDFYRMDPTGGSRVIQGFMRGAQPVVDALAGASRGEASVIDSLQSPLALASGGWGAVEDAVGARLASWSPRLAKVLAKIPSSVAGGAKLLQYGQTAADTLDFLHAPSVDKAARLGTELMGLHVTKAAAEKEPHSGSPARRGSESGMPSREERARLYEKLSGRKVEVPLEPPKRTALGAGETVERKAIAAPTGEPTITAEDLRGMHASRQVLDLANQPLEKIGAARDQAHSRLQTMQRRLASEQSPVPPEIEYPVTDDEGRTRVRSERGTLPVETRKELSDLQNTTALLDRLYEVKVRKMSPASHPPTETRMHDIPQPPVRTQTGRIAGQEPARLPAGPEVPYRGGDVAPLKEHQLTTGQANDLAKKYRVDAQQVLDTALLPHQEVQNQLQVLRLQRSRAASLIGKGGFTKKDLKTLDDHIGVLEAIEEHQWGHGVLSPRAMSPAAVLAPPTR